MPRLFRVVLFLITTVALSDACANKTDQRSYPLQGQVLSIDAAHKSVTVKHEEIKGFMPAMTMPYEVQDAKTLNTIAPGDLNQRHAGGVRERRPPDSGKKVGSAPLEKPPADAPMPTASSGFELLKPGRSRCRMRTSSIKDGNKRAFADFRGSRVVMTFIYTECPMPTFCPLLDRRFAAMQKPLAENAAMQDVRLVSVSFDPATDTPPVLKAHARRLNADPERWTFLTGDRDDVDRFAARFGVQVSRALNDARDITHNLRTVIIDKDGKLLKVYTGNDWTPEQILGDLKG
jgi:protein SCO1/2